MVFNLLIIALGTMAVICAIVFFFFQLAFWHSKKNSGMLCVLFLTCGFVVIRWILKGSFDNGMPIVPALGALGLLVQFGGFKEQWREFQSDMVWKHSAHAKVAVLYLFLVLSFAGVRVVYYWEDNYHWLNAVPCVVTNVQTQVGETEASYDDGSPTGEMLATKELYLYARPLLPDTAQIKLRLARVVAQYSSQSADDLQVSSSYAAGDTIFVYRDIIVGKP